MKCVGLERGPIFGATMRSSETIREIYVEKAKVLGEEKARKYLSVTFSRIMFNLQESGNTNPEALEEALLAEVEYCKKCVARQTG